MKTTKPKLTPDILLTLSLRHMKTTAEKWRKNCANRIGLSTAKYIRTDRITFKKINPKTGLPLYRDEHIYESANYFIKTTQHGKILDIEEKPKSIIKPQVTIKKKRKIAL